MAEHIGNNGPSESSSAEGRSAVRGSPRGAEPTASRQTSAAVAFDRGGARRDTTAAREATLREDVSRNLE